MSIKKNDDILIKLVINKILKNLNLDDIKTCSMVNKKFNDVYNMDSLWNSLFTIHFNESIEKFKKVFETDSCKDTYKKYLSLKYLKKTLKLTNEIIELVSLKKLDLSNKKIKSIPTEIKNLVSLQYLYLDNNNLTSILEEIGNLILLQHLSLSNNNLTSIPEKLQKCRSLNLSNCKKITNDLVKKLGNYHTLYLSGCENITDESVVELGNCHTLNIAHCIKVTGENIKELHNCY